MEVGSVVKGAADARAAKIVVCGLRGGDGAVVRGIILCGV